jgi:hypothetical protein
MSYDTIAYGFKAKTFKPQGENCLKALNNPDFYNLTPQELTFVNSRLKPLADLYDNPEPIKPNIRKVRHDNG